MVVRPYLSRLIRLDLKSTLCNGSDDDRIGLPKTQFMLSLPKSSNKLIDFANRPGSSFLRSSNRKEIKVSTFKLDTHLSSLAKTLEFQPPSQDSSAILTKLFSMENRTTSLIEKKMKTSLEKKVEDSEKHMHTHAHNAISTMRVIVKISRDDPVLVMRLIDDSTKESTGSV
jgi:hypothetical protein